MAKPPQARAGTSAPMLPHGHTSDGVTDEAGSNVRYGSDSEVTAGPRMSAFPLEADLSPCPSDVGFVPIVDTLKPLDHLVVAVWLTIQGARREGLRHLEEV